MHKPLATFIVHSAAMAEEFRAMVGKSADVIIMDDIMAVGEELDSAPCPERDETLLHFIELVNGESLNELEKYIIALNCAAGMGYVDDFRIIESPQPTDPYIVPPTKQKHPPRSFINKGKGRKKQW